MLLGGIVEPPENVTVTFKDDLDKSFSEVKTVEYGGSCEFIEPPVHEGYTFDGWEIIGNNNGLTSVTKNTTCIAHYKQSGGDDDIIVTYVNGDGDIVIDLRNYNNELLTGEQTVGIKFNNELNGYKVNAFSVQEFGAGSGTKLNTHNYNTSCSFIDTDTSTHDFYALQIFDTDNQRIGQKLWDNGFRPVVFRAGCTSEPDKDDSDWKVIKDINSFN